MSVRNSLLVSILLYILNSSCNTTSSIFLIIILVVLRPADLYFVSKMIPLLYKVIKDTFAFKVYCIIIVLAFHHSIQYGYSIETKELSSSIYCSIILFFDIALGSSNHPTIILKVLLLELTRGMIGSTILQLSVDYICPTIIIKSSFAQIRFIFSIHIIVYPIHYTSSLITSKKKD
jgi:hypothetical protein